MVFVGPKELEHFTAPQKKPAIYMLEASWRKEDKSPFVNELHESEKKLLKSGKPLLEGYPAWVAGQCQGGQLSRLDCIVSVAKVAWVA